MVKDRKQEKTGYFKDTNRDTDEHKKRKIRESRKMETNNLVKRNAYRNV